MKIRFDAPPGSATESQGLAVRYSAAKRRVSSWRWYLLFAGVVALPLYFGLELLLALVWLTMPGQVELQQSFVKAGVAGHVVLAVREGDLVQPGQPVARVEPITARTALPAPAPADTDVGRRRDAAEVEAAAAAREIAARGMLELAEQHVDERERWRRTMAELVAEGAATAAERDSAEARRADAQADLVHARAELTGAREAAGRLRAVGAQAAPASAAASVAASAGDASLPVPAPIAGRVVRLPAVTGDWVAPDSEVAVIQADAAPVVRAWMPPSDGRHARVGAEAQLRFYDGTHIDATVVRVESQATRMPPERLGPLAARGLALVIVLKPVSVLPERYRVHELPVEVRFSRW